MKLALPIACVVALRSVGLAGQTRPDFSGTWAMDLTRSEAAAQGTPIGPVTLAIRQTNDEVHIETTRNGRTEAVQISPGGGESHRRRRVDWGVSLGRREAGNPARHRYQQAGDHGRGSAKPRSGGREMTVEVTLIVEHGYQSGGTGVLRSQNSPNTSKGINVFVKKP